VFADSEQQTLSSKEAISKLSLKQISYSQHQADYLTAITDLLVAEHKGVWNNLPSLDGTESNGFFGGSSVPVPLKQNLTLIEASLYHYFGMELEAEKRYQSVITDQSTHLPTAFLLLARYYHEIKDFSNVLIWANKVDRDKLSEDQQDILDFYTLNAFIHTAQKDKAVAILDELDETNWLPVLSFNARRMFATPEGGSEDWAQNIEFEDVTPLLSELYAHQTIQSGIDAVEAGNWGNAVELFKTVPANALRSSEARRWLAWSLLNNEEIAASSEIWHSLTKEPAHLALDSFAMAASTVERLGEKESALVLFQDGIQFYERQVSDIDALRARVADGDWFKSLLVSGESFWAPVHIEIPHEDALYHWTSSTWQLGSFQQLLADYRDLAQMTKLLESKSEYARLFGYMVENREQAFQNTQSKISRMDAAKKLAEYRKQLSDFQNQLDKVADYKDVYSVGDKKQLINQSLLEKIKTNIETLKSMKGYARKHRTSSYEERFQHLEKIYLWEMSEAFPTNYRRFERQVGALADQIAESDVALNKMQKAQDFAPERFKGYSRKVALMDKRLEDAINQSQHLQDQLKTQVLRILDQALIEKQAVAQKYLEQTILAAARLQDELAFELTSIKPSQDQLSNGGTN
jgi:hypothetical protein